MLATMAANRSRVGNYKDGRCVDYPGWLRECWSNIMQRCHNPNDPNYKNYGARGITVYEAWKDPIQFMEWVLANLGTRPDGFTIERVNNDGGYEPGNLRWATRSEQLKNRRTYRKRKK